MLRLCCAVLCSCSSASGGARAGAGVSSRTTPFVALLTLTLTLTLTRSGCVGKSEIFAVAVLLSRLGLSLCARPSCLESRRAPPHVFGSRGGVEPRFLFTYDLCAYVLRCDTGSAASCRACFMEKHDTRLCSAGSTLTAYQAWYLQYIACFPDATSPTVESILVLPPLPWNMECVVSPRRPHHIPSSPANLILETSGR